MQHARAQILLRGLLRALHTLRKCYQHTPERRRDGVEVRVLNGTPAAQVGAELCRTPIPISGVGVVPSRVRKGPPRGSVI
jgi:hypothetical protein